MIVIDPRTNRERPDCFPWPPSRIDLRGYEKHVWGCDWFHEARFNSSRSGLLDAVHAARVGIRTGTWLSAMVDVFFDENCEWYYKIYSDRTVIHGTPRSEWNVIKSDALR